MALTDLATTLASTGIFALAPEATACRAHLSLDIPLGGDRVLVTSTPGAQTVLFPSQYFGGKSGKALCPFLYFILFYFIILT